MWTLDPRQAGVTLAQTCRATARGGEGASPRRHTMVMHAIHSPDVPAKPDGAVRRAADAESQESAIAPSEHMSQHCCDPAT
mmetsp:Transcript_6839/g.17780  ORF Transcript_6839/g.17780 Transcript_6839/m.17780 type:complete len:81 (+) Transcript_6839:86-328(+)